MPITGEHACRLAPPGDYREFARKNEEQESEGKKIDVIYGIKMKAGKRISEIQSLRYKTENWTEDEAEKHCKGRKGTFEPAKEEVKVEPMTKTPRSYFWASPISLKEGEHLVDIEILREGQWKHAKAPSGLLDIDKAKLQEFIENFDNKIVGDELPLDIDHKGPTIGWIKKLWTQTKDGLLHLFARLDITDEKVQAQVKNGSLKYFSPGLEYGWTDPETGEQYDLIRSGALSNWPFIKNMKPAVVNFSEIKQGEGTPDRKEASQLLLVEAERDEAKEMGRAVAQELIKTTRKVKLQEGVIVKLQASTRIDNLVNGGDLSPFEGQEMRKLALSEPQSVNLAISLLKGRGKAWEPGQLSILTQQRRSRKFNLDEEWEEIDKIENSEKRERKLKLLDQKIEGLRGGQ